MTAVGFKDGRITGSGSQDIGDNLVGKDYLIERYPYLIDSFRFAGLWGWGRNFSGQLGIYTGGAGADRSSPVQTVASGANWKQVAAGIEHSAAIKTDGRLWMWGSNSQGQLGQNNTTNQSSPVQVIGSATTWKQVDAGSAYTGAVKTDGTLWMWGYNAQGQLGNNNTTNRSSPTQTVTGGTNWRVVAVGNATTAAIKTDGTLWLWGLNGSGQLGDNTTVSRSSPVQTVAGGTNWKQVDTENHIAAIKTDGTLWTWGEGLWGGLGSNSTASRSSPAQTISGGTNWKQVSCGLQNVGAIKTDGTAWMWGQGQYGRNGNNSTTNRSSPVQLVNNGTNSTAWRLISVARYHCGALKADGSLWMWGRNNFGGLGINNTTDKSSPVQTITGDNNWKSLNVGGGQHTLAIRDTSEDLW